MTSLCQLEETISRLCQTMEVQPDSSHELAATATASVQQQQSPRSLEPIYEALVGSRRGGGLGHQQGDNTGTV